MRRNSVTIVPLAIYPDALNQALSIKYLLLKLIAIIAVSILLIQALTKGVNLRITGLEWPIIVFLLIIVISTATSIHTATSIEGSYLRYDGLLSYVICGALFFLASQYLANTRERAVLIKMYLLTASIISLYGILQSFGYDPVDWGFFAFEEKRSFATFGNPIILAGYLSLILPVAIAKLIGSKSSSDSLAYSIASILITVCLVTSMSRAAWIGAIIGTGIVVLLIIRTRNINLKTAVVPILICIGIITLSIAVIGAPAIYSRAASITSLDGSMGTRLYMWSSAAEMVYSKPLLGFGPDTLGIVFSAYESIDFAKIALGETVDNVHNIFLQMGATTGVLSVLLFLFITILLFAKALKGAGSKQLSITDIGLLGGCVAFLIQSLTGVTGIATSAFFWIFMGCLASSLSTSTLRINPVRSLGQYPLTVAIVIAGLFAAYLSTNPFFGEISLAKARIAKVQGDSAASEYYYKRAIQIYPNDDKAHREYGIMLADMGASSRNAGLWHQGICLLQDSVELSPVDYQNSMLAGQGFLYGARAFDASYYTDAHGHLSQAVAKRPYSSTARAVLGVVYLETKRLKEAEQNLSLALEINPSDSQARYYMGRYYETVGERDYALREYKSAFSVNSENRRAKFAYERLVSSDK